MTRPRVRVEPLRWDQSPCKGAPEPPGPSLHQESTWGGCLQPGRGLSPDPGPLNRTSDVRPPAPDLGWPAPCTGPRTSGPLHRTSDGWLPAPDLGRPGPCTGPRTDGPLHRTSDGRPPALDIGQPAPGSGSNQGLLFTGCPRCLVQQLEPRHHPRPWGNFQ